MVDVDRYLQRLGLSERPAANLDALTELHRRHLYTVPFENLDIHLGRPIELRVDGLADKVIGQERGGFCYELNGLFVSLLSALGFEATLIEGRVYGSSGVGIRYDHAAIMVSLPSGQQLLVDVGFGDSFLTPLPFVPDVGMVDNGREFTIASRSDSWFDLIRDGTPQYRFSTDPVTLDAFRPGCHHHQTSPESPFTQKTVCSLATVHGRQTLSGLRLKTTATREAEGSPSEVAVDPSELGIVLRDTFGIELSNAQLARLVEASLGRDQ